MRNTQIAYCVTDGGGVPEIAEAKDEIQPSHQVQALSNEIKGFAGTVASLMEEKDQIINEQKELLQDKDERITRYVALNCKFYNSLVTLKRENTELKALNEQFQERIEELEHISEREEHETFQDRAESVSESEEEYCHGEGKAPYFTHYGSDSDNDFGGKW